MEIVLTPAGVKVVAALVPTGLSFADLGIGIRDLEELELIEPLPGPVSVEEIRNLQVDEKSL